MATEAPSRVGAGAFFAELLETWKQAARAAGAVETRSYRIAGNELELRFAGDALVAPLTRSLAHLPAGDGVDALCVHLWDSESTATSMPSPPWGREDYRERGRIEGFFDERVQSVFQWGSRSLVMLDLERRQALYWTQAAAQVPSFEAASPLLFVLRGWLAAHGAELLHAAAVGTDDGCALLVGKAGSGKSWSSLAATAAGLGLLGDDYCVLAPGAPARIASLYSAAKAHGGAIDSLSFLDGRVSNPVREHYDKAVYFLHECAPERLLLEARLRAILVPRIGGAGPASLRPVSGAAALAALAPSTILQLPGAGEHTLERLAAIAREVPCYRLELGPELGEIGPAIVAALG